MPGALFAGAALPCSAAAASGVIAHVDLCAFAKLVEIVGDDGGAGVKALDGGDILLTDADGDVTHGHGEIGPCIGDGINEGPLRVALDGGGGYEGLVVQGVDNQSGIDELVGKASSPCYQRWP